MVQTKEQILAAIKEKIGDTPEDKDLEFLENLTDTIDDLNNRVEQAGDWKQKYEENDKMWKEKYTSRFFNAEADEDVKEFERTKLKETQIEEPKKLTFDALFSDGADDK